MRDSLVSPLNGVFQMPVPAFSAIEAAAMRAERRWLRGAFRFTGALGGLIACGLLVWWHRAKIHAVGDAHEPLRALCLMGGAAYYLALGAWAWVTALRLNPRNPLDLVLARERFYWTVLVLFCPVLLLGVVWLAEATGGQGLEGLSAFTSSGSKRRQDR